MHDVDVRAGQFGEGHQMMHAFRFDERRAALVMLLRAGLAGGEQFLLPLGDERLVFAMRGDDHAEFLRELQRAIKLRVVDAERAFVGEEDFEAS